MGSTLRLVPALVASLAIALAGCSDDDGDGEPAGASEESGPPSPCDVIDAVDVEQAFGETVEGGGPGVGSSTVDDVAWESKNCDWEQDGVLEVQLALAEADDFEAGEVLCPELRKLGTPSEPVTDLGDEEGYWVAEESTEVEGKLRICRDDLLIDVEAEAALGSRDLDTLREQTIALGRVVLDRLG